MSDESNPAPGEQLHPANTPSESGSPTPAENPLGESTPPAPQVQPSQSEGRASETAESIAANPTPPLTATGTTAAAFPSFSQPVTAFTANPADFPNTAIQPATDLETAFHNAVDTEVSKEEKTFEHGFTTPPQVPAPLPKAFQNLSQDPLLANQELRALIGPEIARLQQLDATRGILSAKDVIHGTFHD